MSLFVHVESATHKISDVVKKDERFSNFPDFFGEVHNLGAALLVDATTNLFRTAQDGKKHPRLSLEHLISKYSLFAASQPRDTIYAFLSIARDTKPETSVQSFLSTQNPEMQHIQAKLRSLPKSREIFRVLTEWARRMSSVQPYLVNYDLPAEEIYKDFIWFSIQNSMRTDATRALDIICRPWAPRVQPADARARMSPTRDGQAETQMPKSTGLNEGPPLPSWIPDLTEAPYGMDVHAKEELGSRMKRTNADLLVGLPSSGERIYSAAGTRNVDTRRTHFLTGSAQFPPATKSEPNETVDRPRTPIQRSVGKCVGNMGPCHCQLETKGERYYSMFVEGFVLDQIGSTHEASQNGAIPQNWLRFARDNTSGNENIPDELWRTLVADRGPHGQNALTFYPRTCQEAFRRLANDPNNALNTTFIIEQGGCTIIAEFLRRVQAVIWNRRLMRTKRGHHLGLVHEKAIEGDLICILYGCSVPVVLRRRIKSEKQLEVEQIDQIRMEKKTAAEFIARNWKQTRARRKAVAAWKMGQAPLHPLRRRTTIDFARDGIEKLPEKLSQARKRISQITSATVSRLRRLSQSTSSRSFQPYWTSLAVAYFAIWLVPVSAALRKGKLSELLHPMNTITQHKQLDTVVPLGIVTQVPWLMVSWLSTIILPVFLGWELAKLAVAEIFHLWQKLVSSKRAGLEKPAADPKYYYTMIGECYVHQMMDGEAIAWQNEDRDNRRPMIFELR